MTSRVYVVLYINTSHGVREVSGVWESITDAEDFAEEQIEENNIRDDYPDCSYDYVYTDGYDERGYEIYQSELITQSDTQ